MCVDRRFGSLKHDFAFMNRVPPLLCSNPRPWRSATCLWTNHFVLIRLTLRETSLPANRIAGPNTLCVRTLEAKRGRTEIFVTHESETVLSTCLLVGGRTNGRICGRLNSSIERLFTYHLTLGQPCPRLHYSLLTVCCFVVRIVNCLSFNA